MAGRPRKSDKAKKLAGTFQPCRAKTPPPANGLTKAPEPPDDLDDTSRAEWEHLAPLLAKQRTLAEADLRSLKLLCKTLATAAKAEAAIETEGLTVRTARGDLRAHPSVKAMETARAQAARLLIEFGLTPRARNHVEPTNDPDPENPFSKL